NPALRPGEGPAPPAFSSDRHEPHAIAKSRAHHRAQIADTVDQPLFQRLSARQDVAAEQRLVSGVDLPGAAVFDMVLEGGVDVLLQDREPLDIAVLLGEERVEQRFVFAGGMQAALDADAVDQPGKAETTADDADGAEDGGFL